jgi:hypothetical protein
MVFYDGNRIWLAVDICPGCGADHPEMEFKRTNDTLVARCYRSKSTLVYDEETKVIRVVEETPKG